MYRKYTRDGMREKRDWKRMKILLVTDQFFSANNGMTISARRFCETLRAHGHTVRIVSTGRPGDTEYLMKKQYIPVFDRLITSQGMVFAKTDVPLLRRAFAWADVAHFLTPFALTHNGIRLCREMKVPYTAAFHVQPENITSSIHLGKAEGVNHLIYNWFRWYVYRWCGHVHCPSRFIAGELERHHYPCCLHVISNGIDPDFVYRKLPHPPGLEGRFLLLSIGRLSIEKRQDVILRAAALSRYKTRITIRLAGQGPRRRVLEKLAQKCGVSVEFGFYPKEELLDLIASSDLYIHAADAEIEAMSCMEAFAGGLVPVIADSDKSATPQFALDDRSLFPAGDPAALAGKIDYWIEHPGERQEMELAYAELGKTYNLDACVRQAEDMFSLAAAECGERGTLDASVKQDA